MRATSFRQKPNSRRRPCKQLMPATGLLLMIGSILICIVSVEAFLRIYEHEYFSNIIQRGYEKRQAFYGVIPFDVRYDVTDMDFRQNISTMGMANSLIVLGDSFTYGYGLTEYETYPAQLQLLLNESSQDGLDGANVINLGYPGLNTGDINYVYAAVINDSIPSAILYGYFFNDPEFSSINSLDTCGLTASEIRQNTLFSQELKVFHVAGLKLSQVLARLSFHFAGIGVKSRFFSQPSELLSAAAGRSGEYLYFDYLHSDAYIGWYCTRKGLAVFRNLNVTKIFYVLARDDMSYPEIEAKVVQAASNGGFIIFDLPAYLYYESRTTPYSGLMVSRENLHFNKKANMLIAQGLNEFILNSTKSG